MLKSLASYCLVLLRNFRVCSRYTGSYFSFACENLVDHFSELSPAPPRLKELGRFFQFGSIFYFLFELLLPDEICFHNNTLVEKKLLFRRQVVTFVRPVC